MFTLINLPYASLAPVISDRTLSFHHGKHLRGYVDTLNKLVAGTELEGMSLEETARRAPAGPVFNNAGQILNHNLYFTQFQAPAPAADGAALPVPEPSGALRAAIDAAFGSFSAFQDAFVAKGVGLFGSGWVWLAADAGGTLQILPCPGAGHPVAQGLRPLLTFDVWEHAYYLDYQNLRAAHLKSLWSIVDWQVVEERYGKR